MPLTRHHRNQEFSHTLVDMLVRILRNECYPGKKGESPTLYASRKGVFLEISTGERTTQ